MWKFNSFWTSNRKYKLGALVDTLAYTGLWLGLINFIFNAGTFYNTTFAPYITIWLPWFNMLWFYVFAGGGSLLIIMVLEYFIIFPARQHFRNKWEVEQESPLMKELKDIRAEIKDLKVESCIINRTYLVEEIKNLKEEK